MPGEKRDLWVTVIGIGKLLKALVLVVVGIVAIAMMEGEGAETLRRGVEHAGLSPGSHIVHKALEKAAGLDHRRLAEIGAGTFVYAAFFLVEGIGLLLRKRWAEYFTIGITGSFVPLEVYETVRHVTPFRIVGIVLNVAVVAYLVRHVTSKRSGQGAPRHLPSTD